MKKIMLSALLSSIAITGYLYTSTNTATTQANGNLIYLSSESQFNDLIKNGNAVVDFYADWCGPCRRLGPELQAAANERADVTFIKVNTDSFKSLSNKYGVRGIPALFFLKNGNVVGSSVGFMSKQQLINKINSVF